MKLEKNLKNYFRTDFKINFFKMHCEKKKISKNNWAKKDIFSRMKIGKIKKQKIKKPKKIKG